MADDASTTTRIDGRWLERMARVARGFPGSTVVVRRGSEGPVTGPRMAVDGVAVSELLHRCANLAGQAIA